MKLILNTIKEDFVRIMSSGNRLAHFKELRWEKFAIDLTGSAIEPIYDVLMEIEKEQKELGIKEGFNVISMSAWGYEKGLRFNNDISIKHFLYIYKLRNFFSSEIEVKLNKMFEEIKRQTSQSKLDLMSDILNLRKQMEQMPNRAEAFEENKRQIVKKFLDKYKETKEEFWQAMDVFFGKEAGASSKNIKRNLEFLWTLVEVKKDLNEIIYSMILEPKNLGIIMKRIQEPLEMFYTQQEKKNKVLKIEEELLEVYKRAAKFETIVKNNKMFKTSIEQRKKVVKVSEEQPGGGAQGVLEAVQGKQNEKAKALERGEGLVVEPYELKLKSDYVKLGFKEPMSTGWVEVASNVDKKEGCLCFETQMTSKINSIKTVREKNSSSGEGFKILSENLETFKLESLNIKKEYLSVNAKILGAKIVGAQYSDRQEDVEFWYKDMVCKAQSELQKEKLEQVLVGNKFTGLSLESINQNAEVEKSCESKENDLETQKSGGVFMRKQSFL